MTTEIFEKLAAPFPPESISWRAGSFNKDKTKAKALAYLDARDVMRRLDEVVGPGFWQCRYVPMPNGTTCCEIGLCLSPNAQWVWKANGAGNTDIEAEKGAYSDAFKRAAVLWGIGQYLYDIDSPWVALNQWKQIEESELPRLRALLGGKAVSAYQARKDGQYPRLESGMRACTSLDDLAAFWRREQDAIGRLPPNWQKQLRDEKDRMKQELSQEAA